MEDGTACNESLGMGDGRIGDSQLSSNSVWRNMAGHAVVKGRYYPGVAGKGWCADVPVLDDVWYQIDFQKVVNTTGLILKGKSMYLANLTLCDTHCDSMAIISKIAERL